MKTMGNIAVREKPDKNKGTPEGLRFRSLFENRVEKKRTKERNNNEILVKINCSSVNSLIKMVHDNVISQNLSFKGPFGHRRCKCERTVEYELFIIEDTQ